MTSEGNALRVALDRSRTGTERISALKALVQSTGQDVLDGVTALAEDEAEPDQIAYEAGWTLARIHAIRGSLDDVFWANFSHAADHGFFHSGAELHGVILETRPHSDCGWVPRSRREDDIPAR